MRAQAQTAPEVQHSIAEQQTPVIVKVGGDSLYEQTGTTGTTPVAIDSPFMPFHDTVPGLTWETAQSTSAGRIIEMSLVDGKGQPPQDFPINPSDETHELTSVRIEYETAQLLIMETGIPPNNILLAIASVGVPFNLTNEGNWNYATADFPPLTRVILMQGTKVIVDYKFQNTDARFNVQFRRN